MPSRCRISLKVAPTPWYCTWRLPWRCCRRDLTTCGSSEEGRWEQHYTWLTLLQSAMLWHCYSCNCATCRLASEGMLGETRMMTHLLGLHDLTTCRLSCMVTHPLVLHRVAAHRRLQLLPHYLWGGKHHIADDAHMVLRSEANQVRLQAHKKPILWCRSAKDPPFW